MSYFARIDGTLVAEVISADQTYIDSLPNKNEWLQTSYNTKGNVHYGPDGKPDGGIALRGNYAGIGYTYNEAWDVFYAPKPFDSWILNPNTFLWEAPIPMPADAYTPAAPDGYFWNEMIVNWQKPLPNIPIPPQEEIIDPPADQPI